MRKHVKFNSPKEVEEFVTVMNKYKFDAELISGRFCVDAKSFLGIFSMGFERALTLEVYGEDENLEADLAPFAVEEKNTKTA